MNIKKVFEFVVDNIDYFTKEEITKLYGGKILEVLESFKEKIRKDPKDRYFDIIDFLLKVYEDYKKEAYKYDYNQCSEEKHFKYWFDYYFDYKLVDYIEKVLKDRKAKFWETKLYKKCLNKYLKYRQKLEKEYKDLMKEIEYDKQIRYINFLIQNWQYWQATKLILDLLEKYPNDKKLEKLFDKVQKHKQDNFLETVDYEKEIIEKLEISKKFKYLTEKERKQKLKELYKFLDQFLKEKNYNAWIATIKYLRTVLKIEDKKLISYYKKFLVIKERQERRIQKAEYEIELKSLKLLIKNKKYDRALAKVRHMMYKYTLIDKKELIKLFRQIQKEKRSYLKVFWKESFWDKLLMKYSKLSKKSLFEFYEKIAWFLRAKIDIKFALEIIYYQSKDYWLKKFSKDLLDWVQAWLKISEVMSWYWYVIDLKDIALVKIWEKTGKLADVFESIYTSHKVTVERKKKIKSMMIYPVVVILITIIIFTWLLIFIVPKFVKFYEQVNVPLPWITVQVINLSNIIRYQRYLIILFIIWLIVFIWFFKRTRVWKRFFSWCALNLPVIKLITPKLYIIYVTQNLSLLLRAWVPILEALDLLVMWVENLYYYDELRRIRYELELWTSMGEVLWLGKWQEIRYYSNKLFPIDIAYSIDIWEKTWQLVNVLGEIAERYDKDLKIIINNLQSLIEPFVILLVWWVVFVMVLAIFLPLIHLYDVIWKMSKVR